VRSVAIRFSEIWRITYLWNIGGRRGSEMKIFVAVSEKLRECRPTFRSWLHIGARYRDAFKDETRRLPWLKSALSQLGGLGRRASSRAIRDLLSARSLPPALLAHHLHNLAAKAPDDV
jgi:hypothetical protein